MNRRDFLKLSAAAGAATFAVPGFAVRGGYSAAQAAKMYVPAMLGLSDPASQPKFVESAPNALHPNYKYSLTAGEYTVGVGYNPVHRTGLVDELNNPLVTPIFGYGEDEGEGYVYRWPGKTFEVQKDASVTVVNWENNLHDQPHLLPVDTSLHWCYSLPNYGQYSIDTDGIPIVVHLHGGHTDFQYDGNPEFFYSPGGVIRGPQWASVPSDPWNPGGFTNKFVYDNNVPAGNLWYHDHALGITRLNVYAGMAGFYFVRDGQDTGMANNPLGLPAYPYELAYAIQDRMFRDSGELFYPAYPGEPFYADFIATPLPDPPFTDGGPTALAEFFGDHMVVNGKIWPKAQVEPRHYRMRLLNGCDSRFMVLRFRAVGDAPVDGSPGPQVIPEDASSPLKFWVIGSDQGLAAAATETRELLFEPGGRYDIVFDFSDPALAGKRIIMENIASDAPFGGKARGSRQNFFPNRQTDRVMAFDVVAPLDVSIADNFDPALIGQYVGNQDISTRTRKVALFEGMDEYGRLQPLLGTAEPATDASGFSIDWPSSQPYVDAGLIGPMEGSIAWHSPTTENPKSNSTEIWEIYNATADAHPVHLHLVNFEILDRQKFKADVLPQPVIQHNSAETEMTGQGFRLANIKKVGRAKAADGIEKAPKDMVTALPGEVTRIKVTFDKDGRYVWHCHILSHEDHEMMRVLHVGPGAAAAMPAGQMLAAEADTRDDADAPDRTDSGETIYMPFVSGE